MQNIIIAPSILSADPLRFGDELSDIEKCGADWHHVDVMDGHFVPNLTFGLPLIRALRRHVKIPLDVHIMVTNPDQVALDYVREGADLLSFHLEASRHPHRLLQQIKKEGAKAGIAINPGTPVQSLFSLLDEVDYVLVMSVNPGFSGQSFISYSELKVHQLAIELSARKLTEKVLIQVDGGINPDNAGRVIRAGARALVAGTFVYGSDNRKSAISSLKELVK